MCMEPAPETGSRWVVCVSLCTLCNSCRALCPPLLLSLSNVSRNNLTGDIPPTLGKLLPVNRSQNKSGAGAGAYHGPRSKWPCELAGLVCIPKLSAENAAA